MVDHELLAVLAHAQALGFVGKAPLEDHVNNGLGFAAALQATSRTERPRCVDLGSGGGVPALVMARALTDLSITCVDRGSRRCAFLEEATATLDLTDRVTVVEGDAEDVARSAGHEASYDVVTARSFGPPAVTAEAGARLLHPDGVMLVSEPPTPDAGSRWEFPTLLELLGLRYGGLFDADNVRLAVLTRTSQPVDDRYPRRAATVRKRPLF